MTKEVASKEQVYAACEMLISKDEKLTLDGIRKHIGGGSKTTINKWFKQYKDEFPNKVYDAARVIPMPDIVQEQYQKLWALTYAMAEDKAESDYVKTLEDENGELKEKNLELEQTKAELKQLKESYEMTMKMLTQSYEENGRLKQAMEELNKRIK
ncbi:hypothetical protein Cri9333_2614 [Crinalium epipsammum PCC 9333]|uniref:KfrA N-terminal DNA-binding domain-containing protein n=1 Tax=Crinalium epipsammum PCC 9333 TaxID=1173022 RepID=K9W233_9CYAN|nr:DNA-binding protein [Crinalium epipsammum]AFZ13475.1 hypothetical protein Cri9333_2614 [Crinalium epipsammum PCC 9333]